MAEPREAELWSDMDGTGVELMPKRDPRNWAKYPLRMIDGYIDFLRGVQQGGVEIAGIVSRRPAYLRKWVTARSIAKLGLDEMFPGEHQVVLAGSESRKAQHLVDRSRDHVVGMIDDKPHRLGEELLNLLAPIEPSEVVLDTPGRHQLVLGAVDHPKADEYMDRLGDHVAARTDVGHAVNEQGLHIRGGAFDLLVVQVQPYCVEAGLAFAADVAPWNNM